MNVHPLSCHIHLWILELPQFIYSAARGLSYGMRESLLQHVGSSSPTSDWTQAPCTGSSESQPLDHQVSTMELLQWGLRWTPKFTSWSRTFIEANYPPRWVWQNRKSGQAYLLFFNKENKNIFYIHLGDWSFHKQRKHNLSSKCPLPAEIEIKPHFPWNILF